MGGGGGGGCFLFLSFRYDSTSDGTINLGGDLGAVLNQRDPLNLDHSNVLFKVWDNIIQPEIEPHAKPTISTISTSGKPSQRHNASP